MVAAAQLPIHQIGDFRPNVTLSESTSFFLFTK